MNFRRLQDAWGLILMRFRAGKEQSRVENKTVKETDLAVSLLCLCEGDSLTRHYRPKESKNFWRQQTTPLPQQSEADIFTQLLWAGGYFLCASQPS